MNPKRRIIPIFVPHLGCPNDCVFCNQRKISGSLILADETTVTRTIEEAKGYISGDAELAFYGGSFTAIDREIQRRLLEAAQPYVREGFLSGIRLSTRPDKIDADILDFLRGYGVGTIELGVQSMDDTVLAASGRGHSASDTEKSAVMIKEAGFKLILQMMTGLPCADYDSDVLTADKIIALAPDGVRIYPTVIIKDTVLFELWIRGMYKEHTVEDAVSVCAVIAEAFEKAGITIIRLGLNPTDGLSGGEAAGGAYHPALGQLVRSRMYLNKAEKMIQDCLPAKYVEFGVHKSCVSFMTGQKRSNINILKDKYGFNDVKVNSIETKYGNIEITKII